MSELEHRLKSARDALGEPDRALTERAHQAVIRAAVARRDTQAARVAQPSLTEKWRPSRLAILIGVGLALVGAATAASYAVFNKYAPTKDELAVQGRTVDLETLKVRRTIESPAGVKWTVVTYESSDGLCLEAFGERVAGSTLGKLGGCGIAEDAAIPYTMGGLRVGRQWFNVIFGQTSGATVRVTLGNGAVREDSPQDSIWIVVAPGRPTDPKNDFTRVEILDSGGEVVASAKPVSLAQLRQQAQKAGAEPTTP